MTTTPSEGDANNATSATTQYSAGLGAVVAYNSNGSTVAPNPTGATDGSTSKYTAGNQVQSAWYTLVAPIDGATTPSAGLIGKYLTGTPATSTSNSNVTVSNLTSYSSNYTNSSENNYNNFYTSAPVATTDSPAADTTYIPIKMPTNYNFQVLANGLTDTTNVAFLNHNGVV